ncbi:class I adenylate-forming enzyme family protein [Streptomyces soliscabiei]|uniref:class I adenylate-forming enzyme family protein n=1 Tax=Streptomyces soliscabiei TaxID=588897 RepID=UPI0029B5F2FA|nr:AMP-binding protein [Streptomyces sp. NY05-11A]MDX2675076.1 AMP-binding protein [Streptomyces sp. NY05-11A]
MTALRDGSAALAAIPRTWAAHTPEAACLTYEDTTLTWHEVHERSRRVAQGLADSGGGPGERVLYLGRNRPEFFEVLFGASMAGQVSVAVNWRLIPRELLFVVNNARPKTVFVTGEFRDRLDSIRDELTTVESVVVIGDDCEDYEKWLARRSPQKSPVVAADTDPALMMYTSGTTGVPKAALFDDRALRATFRTVEFMGVTRDSVLLAALPLFHAAGLNMAIGALAAGAHCVLAADAKPRSVLELAERHRVTATMVVPSVLKAMEREDADRYDLSALDVIGYAGSPIEPELLRSCLRRYRCRFFQLYGMTETIGISVLGPEDHDLDDRDGKLLSAGRPLPDVTVRVVDPITGQDVAEGVVGEVWARTPTAMSGYWADPEETARVLTPDGFVRTGDAGFLRAGWLHLRDRLKDVVISGGENVYPGEVERVLSAHPGIADVAVVGAPSERWGETVRAVVVRRPSHASLTEDEVISYAREHLAGYKCPTVVDFAGQLPRNASGKVLKTHLREP